MVKKKECKSCRIVKSLTDFYSNSKYKDGVNPICKSCYKRKIQKKNTIKTFAIPVDIDYSQPLKVCIQCWVEKPASSDYFAYDSKTKDCLKVICQKCEQINNEFFEENEYIQESNNNTCSQLHRCGNCGRLLEKERFRNHKSYKDHIFTPMCIDCINNFVSFPNNNGGTKKCRICGITKVATSDNFQVHIYKRGFLRDECRECNNKNRNEHRQSSKNA
jgi:hypothetical protein